MNYYKFLNKYPSLENKLIIITGANSGVGFECSKHILSKGAKLVMAARNFQRASDAKMSLLKLYPNSEIDIILYDQSNIEYVKQLAKDIENKYPDFDALVLNAGIYHPTNEDVSLSEHPLTMYTNYVSNYVLLNDLKSLLDNSKKERKIIIQGSLAARLPSKKVHLLGPFKNKFHEYCLSKYALENLFYDLGNNNKNDLVKYILCEPGITSTNIVRGFPKAFQAVAKVFLKTFMMSPKKASLTMFTSIAGNSNNLDMYIPRGIFAIRGKPKLIKLKKKYISDKYLNEVKDVI